MLMFANYPFTQIHRWGEMVVSNIAFINDDVLMRFWYRPRWCGVSWFY